MAQNEVEEFSLENIETPTGLEEFMADAMRDGLACHPCRVPEDFFSYTLCSFEMFPLRGEQNLLDIRLPALTRFPEE